MVGLKCRIETKWKFSELVFKLENLGTDTSSVEVGYLPVSDNGVIA